MKKAEKADAERQWLDRIIVAVLKASPEDLDISRAELAGGLDGSPSRLRSYKLAGALYGLRM